MHNNGIIRICTKPYDDDDVDDHDGTMFMFMFMFISARIELWIHWFCFLLIQPPSMPPSPPPRACVLFFLFICIFLCFIISRSALPTLSLVGLLLSAEARREGSKYNTIKVIKPVLGIVLLSSFLFLSHNIFAGSCFGWKLRRVKKTLDYQAMLIFACSSI